LCGVVHIPAQGFEKGIDEFTAELRFVIFAGLIGFTVAVEAINELGDFFGRCHSQGLKGYS